MTNNYQLTDSELYNTGGGCMVLFMDVQHTTTTDEPADKLIQISYDGETIAGLNLRYQDAEEGIELENQLWIAHSWPELIEAVGIDLALDVSKQIKIDWMWSDNLEEPEAIRSIENLIDLATAASQLHDNWHLNVAKNTRADYEKLMVEIFSWQQQALDRLRK